uniref:Uncharacterized protein n=1 Tax=Marseillevirus LCMAC201 TaxID=2506605 RepID=A0A481YX87_9VIRU|nr:MAG: hypothetical protein LCMAC201_04210 [Marseillevirus LCMAC201]
MENLDLTRQDLDQLIRNFRVQPNRDVYFNIQTWYENNIQDYFDQEYIICVYLFLLGANIKHRYREFTYEQHLDFVKEIRQLIEEADALNKMQRKAYLDFGTKSG